MSTKALAGYAKYDNYKYSGVDWLGNVPSDWDVIKLKHLVSIRKRIIGHEGVSVLSITQKGIKVKDITSGEGQLSMDYSKYQIVNQGDFAMNHMDLLTGYVDISKFDGVVSPDYRVFTNDSQNVDDSYLLKIFQMGYAQEIFFKYGQGVSMLGRWRLPADNFNEFLVPLPSLKEQEKIISFLNSETAKIDQAIELKQQQIEKLNEYKQITIQNAVTKGLDANAKMKDSGIDWIGDIPEHWEVKKLKYIARLKSGDTFNSDDFLDEGYEVYGGNGFRGYTNTYTNEGEYILIGRQGALCGNVNYARGKFYATEHAIVVHPINELNLEWLGESIKHANFNRLSTSAAQPGISVQVVREVSFPYCSLEEQDEIGIFIKKVINNVEKALSNFAQQIERLNDYKTILINQAVTGKIKVS